MPFRMFPGLILVLTAAIPLVLPYPQAPPRPPNGAAPSPAKKETAVHDDLHRRIDEWIARHGLNEYGDPPGTMYMGGSPLFDETTGVRKDRYAYILEQHPELKDDGARKR